MRKLFAVLALLVSFNALADSKLGIMGSLNYNTSENDDLDGVTGVDEKSGVGFGIGLRALMGITDQLYFRSGAGIVNKRWSYDINDSGIDGSAKMSFVYLNVPATLYWKASPQIGFFGGTALQAKLSDDCDGDGNITSCEARNTKSIVLPAIIGFDFNINEQLALEISYEHGITEVAKDTKVHSAVVSFIFNFGN